VHRDRIELDYPFFDFAGNALTDDKDLFLSWEGENRFDTLRRKS
jgi:hypothetical protein